MLMPFTPNEQVKQLELAKTGSNEVNASASFLHLQGLVWSDFQSCLGIWQERVDVLQKLVTPEMVQMKHSHLCECFFKLGLCAQSKMSQIS